MLKHNQPFDNARFYAIPISENSWLLLSKKAWFWTEYLPGWQEGNEYVAPHMEEVALPDGGTKSVQNGFDAHQDIVISTKDLNKIVTANKDFLTLQAEGRPFEADSPLYLVSQLEDIKMSLISSATENARKRANEFTKQDGVTVGVMHSASQGAFYILAAGANGETDDYGGVYDKSTINKIAKVVVTIVYGIE